MKRTGLIITILFIVAMFFIQHRSTPNIALPPAAKMVGVNVEIPLNMQLPSPTEETWTLATRQFKTFYANVYNKGQLVKQFATSGNGVANSSGTNFSTTGNIMFNAYQYRAEFIHVNRDKKSGYIRLVPVKSAS